jgi:hypothetical protein
MSSLSELQGKEKMESPMPRRDFPFFRFYAKNRLKKGKKEGFKVVPLML